MENETRHWTEEKEQTHSNLGLKISVAIINFFPLWVTYFITIFVSFFYMIFSARARREIKRFQIQLNKFTQQKKHVHYYLPIFSFALSLMEKFAGWSGKLPADNVIYCDDDIVELGKDLENGKGAVFICSHLGNIEILRSLATYNRTYVSKPIYTTVIMDLGVTTNYNETLKSLNSNSELDVIAPSEISIDTMSLLTDRIESGGIVVIAGDRTSKSTIDRSLEKSFLGKNALFPYGTFLLAALLNAPTYFIFGLRTKVFTLAPKNRMHVHKAQTQFDCSRKERAACIENLCDEFVFLLEKYAKENPYQWYNFYDFWARQNN